MLKILTALLAFLGLSVIIYVISVNVCHATGSDTNPYNLITVAIHSVNDANGLNGHGNHKDDAWKSFEFEGVLYPGQNEGLFGDLINDDCSLIVAPTPTNTLPPPTNTSTPTNTLPPPTNTSTPTTPVETPPVVVTSTPTLPPNPPPIITPTEPPNPPPVITPTLPPNPPPTFTSTVPPNPPPTNTPIPPKASYADGKSSYAGTRIGNVILGDMTFELYEGVNAEDGSLSLPSYNKGAALYNNVIWVHREWRTGHVNLATGSVVSVNGTQYLVTKVSYLPYGVYPDKDGFYVASCYRDDLGDWKGVALYKLSIMRILHDSR